MCREIDYCLTVLVCTIDADIIPLVLVLSEKVVAGIYNDAVDPGVKFAISFEFIQVTKHFDHTFLKNIHSISSSRK